MPSLLVQYVFVLIRFYYYLLSYKFTEFINLAHWPMLEPAKIYYFVMIINL